MVPPTRAAEIARDNGVTIYPIAMGDPRAAGEQALDEVTLEEVAATPGGEYFHADDREDLERIYQTLDQLNPKQVESLSYRPEHELYFWPLALAIILSQLFFGKVELKAFLQARPHQLRSDEAAAGPSCSARIRCEAGRR
jgi:Ca-activated chloride channel family protein